MKIDAIPTDKILLMAEEHITRFTRLLDSDSPDVRVGECQHYLALWQSIKSKGGTIANLSKPELVEIEEAINCGDYDKLLGINSDDFESEDEDATS